MKISKSIDKIFFFAANKKSVRKASTFNSLFNVFRFKWNGRSRKIIKIKIHQDEFDRNTFAHKYHYCAQHLLINEIKKTDIHHIELKWSHHMANGIVYSSFFYRQDLFMFFTALLQITSVEMYRASNQWIILCL